MYALDVGVKTDGVIGGKWRLYAIGDPHLDKAQCDEKRLRRYVRMVAADPHAVAVLVGDVIDGTTPSHRFFSPSTTRKEVLASMDDYIGHMLEAAVDVFKPLKEGGTPLVVIEGNHEKRNGIQWSGFARSLARELGAGYGGGEALIRVRAGSRGNTGANLWTVYAAHGVGGGIWPGGKVNRFQNTAAHIADFDIAVRGHVHDSDVRVLPRYGVTAKGPARLKCRPVCYYTAPAFTAGRYEGIVDYDGRKSLPPQDAGLLYIEVTNPRPDNGKGAGGHGGKIRRIEADF